MISNKIKAIVVDVSFWIGIAVLVLWALGKSFGMIHSPAWVEMIPYFSVAIAVSSASIKIGRILERIDYMGKDLSNLRTAVVTIGQDVRDIQKRAACLNGPKCNK